MILDLERQIRELRAQVKEKHEEEFKDPEGAKNQPEDDDAVVEEVLQEFYDDYSINTGKKNHDHEDYYSEYLPEDSRQKRDLDKKVEEELFRDEEETINYLGPEFEEYYEEYYPLPETKKSKRSSDDSFLGGIYEACLLYTSPSPRDGLLSRMPSSA